MQEIGWWRVYIFVIASFKVGQPRPYECRGVFLRCHFRWCWYRGSCGDVVDAKLESLFMGLVSIRQHVNWLFLPRVCLFTVEWNTSDQDEPVRDDVISVRNIPLFGGDSCSLTLRRPCCTKQKCHEDMFPSMLTHASWHILGSCCTFNCLYWAYWYF